MSSSSYFNGTGDLRFTGGRIAEAEPAPAADPAAPYRGDTMTQVRDLLFGEQQRFIETQIMRLEREFRAEISALSARVEAVELKLEHVSGQQSRAQAAAFAELSGELVGLGERIRRLGAK